MKISKAVFYGSVAMMVIGIGFAAATDPGVAEGGPMASPPEETCPAVERCPAFRGNGTGATGSSTEDARKCPASQRFMG